MRAIRTEMYFEVDDVRGYVGDIPRRRRYLGDEKNPGVAFLWFQGDPIDLSDVDNIKRFRRLRGDFHSAESSDNHFIRAVVDLFVRDAEEMELYRSRPDVENPEIVDFILRQDIVMEHSPPFSVSFKALLDTKNSPVWIGTFMGTEAAWDHPVLLMLTVPGGIIIASSAVGIGNAMQAGLNKTVKRLFDGRKP